MEKEILSMRARVNSGIINSLLKEQGKEQGIKEKKKSRIEVEKRRICKSNSRVILKPGRER